MFKLPSLIVLASIMASFNAISANLSDAPKIDEISFGDLNGNCFSGASFFVKSDDIKSDTRLQYFESMNGKDYFLYKYELQSNRSSGSWYEFRCPEASNESIFQVRLVNSEFAGNTMLVPYSSGPAPVVSSVEYSTGTINVEGNHLNGKVEVYYEGVLRGEAYGRGTSLTIPVSLHRNISGLYTLKNQHGSSNSFLIRPYVRADFGYSTSPSLNHYVELRNNCKNFYASNTTTEIEAAQGVCSLENVYAFWGLNDPNDRGDEATVFLPAPNSNSSISAVSPSGYGARIELVVAVDPYQLANYKKYYATALAAGDISRSSNGGLSLESIHYVPLYKAIYLGESRLIMDATTSIAAHVVLDILKPTAKPEAIGQLYKMALSSPVMGSAASRYNQLLTESIAVDYAGRKSLHHIASPLYVGDSRLDGLVSEIASSINANGI